MKHIVYYVASSVDGYIAGPNGEVSGFAHEGTGIQQYLNDLKHFDTVLLGRKTYENGYHYGLLPGQAPYPDKQHYIFSNTLQFENSDPNVAIAPPDADFVRRLKNKAGADIYLCGGGELAGWLLDNQLIDYLKIKLNPLLLNGGTRLFGKSVNAFGLDLTGHQTYGGGLQIITYRIKY